MKRRDNLFKRDKRTLWFSLSLFIAGILLLGWYIHWSAPLGVWLMIWGNNLRD